MKIDVKKLKAMTATAIEKGQEAARKLAAKETEKVRLKKLADERKAQNVIDQIPGRAEREAAEGRNHAIVMAVKFDDYDRPHGANNWNQCDPQWLKRAVKLVFEYCVEADLNPTLESWHDGQGVNSGHNIVIHW